MKCYSDSEEEEEMCAPFVGGYPCGGYACSVNI